jgi:rubrerythrin
MARKAATTIWIVDRAGDTSHRCRGALLAEGWKVKLAESPAEVKGRVDAVIVANDLAGLEKLRERPAFRAVPVVLVASPDRSGWDRTFQDETAFGADALLDLPVDASALVKRLRGILQAREAVSPQKPPAEFREIIRRAIANEESAERFYRKAAAASHVPQTRSVLEDLARDERGHKQVLLEFLEGKRPLTSTPVAPSSVVETFGTPELTPDMSPADAFLLAARKEKLAAELYENWAKLYPDGPERELLLQLAAVEHRHKKHVEELFSNASFPEDFFERSPGSMPP